MRESSVRSAPAGIDQRRGAVEDEPQLRPGASACSMMAMALPATSPLGPPVTLTLTGLRRMSMPSSFMVISAKVTTPVEVTAYSLWLMPTCLVDITPTPSR